MAASAFTGPTTITIENLGKKVTTGPTATTTDNNAVFHLMTTGATYPSATASTFTAATQIDASHEYIAFSEDYDQYNVVYFFSASSLVVTASTFEYTGGTVLCQFVDNKPQQGTQAAPAICVDNTIYQIDGSSDLYAVRVTVPEAYDQSATNRQPSFKLILATNDPEIAYNQTLTISQTGCASAS